jgi:hypothetical protein
VKKGRGENAVYRLQKGQRKKIPAIAGEKGKGKMQSIDCKKGQRKKYRL